MPPRGQKRKSDQSVTSETHDAPNVVDQKIATKLDSPVGSPRKKCRTRITSSQKQALIDNLQLEVTERARKLRAQYNLQAQGLRARIEIRVNRIPVSLRKLKMGDLLQKHAAGPSQPLAPKQTVTAAADRGPPPVPEKDHDAVRIVTREQPLPRSAHIMAGRPPKRPSDNLNGGDKENQSENLEGPKKRPRANHYPAGAVAAPHAAQIQVLSPASSNSRLNPRDREFGVGTTAAPFSPAKSFIARPVSPAKQAAATSLLSTMVEKARSTRIAATRKPMISITTSTGPGATRSRKLAVGTTSRSVAAVATASVRIARRASGISESSDASTSTVVRKMVRGRATRATPTTTARKVTGMTQATTTTKKRVIGSIKRGVANATAKKGNSGKVAPSVAAATAATATATATTRSGRVLRKRD